MSDYISEKIEQYERKLKQAEKAGKHNKAKKYQEKLERLRAEATEQSTDSDTDSDDDTALLPGRETWVSQPEELAECYLHVRPADGDKWTKRYCIVHTDGRVAQYRSKTIRKRVLGEVCGWLR